MKTLTGSSIQVEVYILMKTLIGKNHQVGRRS